MTLLAPSFFTVIFVVFGPAWLSPSEIWLGSTTVVASIVPTMSSMPAPWRCAWSRKPSAGFPDQFFGSAGLCSRPIMALADILGRASRISATPPATCGDDIEVPESVAAPPSSSG